MADSNQGRYSNTQPFDNTTYNGQPAQGQGGQAQYYPPPPNQQPIYQRARGSSTGSHHSNHAAQQYQPQQYTPQAQGQLTPFTPTSTRQAYFPPAPPGQPQPLSNQLHPAEAYIQDPFAGRQRRTSATSTASRHSQHSHRSSQSQRSRRSSVTSQISQKQQHRSGRKHGERATLGDSLFGIWDALRSVIPVAKR